MCCYNLQCSLCCAAFSFTGFVFMGMLTLLISLQPEYVLRHQTEHADEARENCLWASLVYFNFMGVAIAAAIWHRKSHAKKHEMHYSLNAIHRATEEDRRSGRGEDGAHMLFLRRSLVRKKHPD